MHLNRKIAPPFQPIRDFELPKREEYHLDNGVKVVHFPSDQQEVMSMDLIFESGKWDQDMADQAHLGMKMLREGTATLSSHGVSQLFDQKGGFLQLSSGSDISVISLYCLSRHGIDLAEVVGEILLGSVFPQRELKRLIGNRIQELRLNHEKSSYLATKHFQEKFFGTSHPYGVTTLPESVGLIDQIALRRFYDRLLSSRMTIVLAGRIEKDMIGSLNRLFGSLAGSKTRPRQIFQGIGATKFLLKRENQSQSSLRLGAPTLTRTHMDYAPLILANEVFGGFFGSRLMKNIREDKGYTYGIYSRLVHLRNASYFLISSDVQLEHTSEVLDEIKVEISNLQTQLVSSEELDLARNHLTGSVARQFGNAFDLAERYKAIFYQDLDLKFYKRVLRQLQEVSSEQVRQAFQSYIQPESFTEVIIGDKQ